MIRSRTRPRISSFDYTPTVQSWDMTSLTSLPAEFTYTRSDTVATYRDSSGNLKLGTTNGIRIDYSITGTQLGILMEDSIQNKCTNFNAIPDAGITNMTKGGDAAATLTRVADTTALTTRKLQNVCTGNVWALDNTTGVADAWVDIGGTTGSVAAHTISCEARLVSGASGKILLNSGVGAVTFSNSAYDRIISKNLTPSATTDQMRVLATAGSKVYFVLNQLEALAYESSYIVTSGAAATRQADKLKDSSIRTRAYYKDAQSAVIVECDMRDINVGTHSFMYVSDNNDGTSGNINSVGNRKAGGRAKTDGQYVLYGPTPTLPFTGDQLSVDKTGDGALSKHIFAVSWKQGGSVDLVRSPAVFKRGSLGSFTTPPNRLYVGGQVFTSALFGHIRKITVINKYLTPAKLAPYMHNSTFNYVLCKGQSNGDGAFSNQSGSTNGGEQAGVAKLDTYWNTDRNYLANGTTSGTSILYYGGTSTASNWWYNKDTGAIGVPLQYCLEVLTATVASGKGTALAIYDASGESDAGRCSKAEYKAAQLAIYNMFFSIIGSTVPVFLKPLGRETSANAAGYQTIREAQRELANENPSFIYILPESFTLAQADSIHMNDAAQATYMAWTADKIAKIKGKTVTGGVDGGNITGVTRSGASMTVTITHDTGATDFTPTSGIAGFHFFDGASEIAVTAAVRASATTITLTLASVPANATQTLYYGYRSLAPEAATYTNMVVDNGTRNLPLRQNVFTSTNTGASFTGMF